MLNNDSPKTFLVRTVNSEFTVPAIYLQVTYVDNIFSLSGARITVHYFKLDTATPNVVVIITRIF